MLNRKRELATLKQLLNSHRAVCIVGARQVGKTTLAHALAAGWMQPVTVFDLEDPRDMARLQDPMLALANLKGLIIIDEIQRYPDLFPVLRVLLDRRSARFLILGSASPELLRQGSESLAGRIVYHDIGGFGMDEIEPKHWKTLWLRGGFPRSYLARNHKDSLVWRLAFIRTFLERDLPQLGITIRAGTLHRFWTMLAHYHGQLWNASEFGRSFGIADTTVRNYLDIMTSAKVIRQLLPWHENISKRQVKSPKIYVTDSGLLHALLNLHTLRDIEGHPKVGASWEGFVLSQIIRQLQVRNDECYFWATHAGAELDLLVVRGRQRLGFEIKRTSAPGITPSMRSALADLKLSRLTVVHAGDRSFQLAEKMHAVSINRLLTDIKPLK